MSTLLGCYPLLNHSATAVEIHGSSGKVWGVVGKETVSLKNIPKTISENQREAAQRLLEQSTFSWNGLGCDVRLGGRGGGCTQSRSRSTTGTEERRVTEDPVAPPASQSTIVNIAMANIAVEAPPAVMEQSPLPTLWNVPPRSQTFTGRESVIVQFIAQLKDAVVEVPMVTITGQPGLGKTCLATELVYRLQTLCSKVVWISSEHPLKSYRELGENLGIVQQDDAPELVVQKVRTWMESQQKELLVVFDNASGPEAMTQYLPTKGCRVIVTTKNTHWENGFSLSTFTLDETEELFFKITRQRDRPSVEQLWERFGGLPLAVAQVGAYIEATGTTIASYIPLYDEVPLDLWNDETPPTGYTLTVAKTVHLALLQIDQELKGAIAPIREAAHYAADNIPRKLFVRAGQETIELQRWLHLLQKYSLLTVGSKEDTYNIHRLVQDVVRLFLSKEESDAIIGGLYTRIKGLWSFNKNDLLNWKQAKAYFTHIRRLTDLTVSSHQEEKAFYLHELGHYLLKVEIDYPQAIELHTKALKVKEILFGTRSTQYAISLLDLSIAYQNNTEIPKAIEEALQALEILTANEGEVSLEVAEAHTILAKHFKSQGSYVISEGHFLDAIRIRTALVQESDEYLYSIYSHLGGLYREMDRQAEAKLAFEKALKMVVEIHGESSQQFATMLSNLALVEPDSEKRIEMFERALNIKKAVLGEKHPDLILLYENLGVAHGPSRTMPYFEQALALCKEVHGEEHNEVSRILQRMGTLQKTLRNPKEARILYERALEISSKALGATHPDLAPLYSDLGILAGEQGDHFASLKYHKNALELLQASAGENDIDVARGLFDVGQTLCLIGLYGEAIKYFEGELKIYQALGDPLAPGTDLTYRRLADCYKDGREFYKTAVAYTKYRESIKKNKGSEVNVDAVIGDCYEKALMTASTCRNTYYLGKQQTDIRNIKYLQKLQQRDMKSAIEYFEQAKNILILDDQPDSLILSDINLDLAMLYLDQDDKQKALACFKDGLRIARIGSKSSADILKFLESIAKVYNDLGQLERALEFRLQALEVGKTIEGEDHHKKIVRLLEIGGCYFDLGNFDQANIYYLEALNLQKKKEKGRDRDVSIILGLLAGVAQKQQNLSQELDYRLQVREIEKKIAGEGGENYAFSLVALGAVYKEMGEKERAVEAYSEALVIYNQIEGPIEEVTRLFEDLQNVYTELGETEKALTTALSAFDLLNEKVDQPKKALMLDGIGILAFQCGDLDRAYDFLNKALDIRKAVLEPNDPNLADSYNNIGLVYRDRGQFDEAIKLLQMAREIRSKVFGEISQNIGEEEIIFATVYERQNNIAKMCEHLLIAGRIFNQTPDCQGLTPFEYLKIAEEKALKNGTKSKKLAFFIETLPLKRELLGESKPLVIAKHLSDLAEMYEENKQLKESLNCSREAFQIYEKFGSSLDIANSSYSFCVTLRNLGQFDEAQVYGQKAIENCVKAEGEKSLNIVYSMGLMGSILRQEKRFIEAIDQFQKTMELLKEIEGPESALLPFYMDGLGLCYLGTENSDKAEEVLQLALALEQKVKGESETFSSILLSLGKVCLFKGEQQAAMDYLQRSLTVLETLHAESSTEYGHLLLTMAKAYKTSGDISNASKYREKGIGILTISLGEDHYDLQQAIQDA